MIIFQLGLVKEEAQDQCLIDELTSTLADTGADYTNLMRNSFSLFIVMFMFLTLSSLSQ